MNRSISELLEYTEVMYVGILFRPQMYANTPLELEASVVATEQLAQFMTPGKPGCVSPYEQISYRKFLWGIGVRTQPYMDWVASPAGGSKEPSFQVFFAMWYKFLQWRHTAYASAVEKGSLPEIELLDIEVPPWSKST
jgi:hypothetical protein